MKVGEEFPAMVRCRGGARGVAMADSERLAQISMRSESQALTIACRGVSSAAPYR